MKIYRVLHIGITCIAIVITIVFGLITFNRAKLDYNETGRYFDEESAVVYHEQVIEVAGFITILLLLVSIGLLFSLKKRQSMNSELGTRNSEQL